MKTTLTMAILAVGAVALLALAPTANATDKTVPKPPPRAEQPPTSTADADAQAAATAAAKAAAVAGSKATSAVGPVTNASELSGEQVAKLRNQTSTDVDLGDTNVEGSTSRSYGLAVSLPQLANAGDIAASGCPDASTSKGARGVLMGVYSSASADQDTDKCTLRMLEVRAAADCQFAEAQAIRVALASKLLGKMIDLGASTNLTPQECIDLRLKASGKVTNTHVVTNNFNRFELNQPPAPVEPPKVAKPPKPSKPRAPICGAGQAPVCTAKP